MTLSQDPIAAIRAADPSRPFVVAQLGQSLDGRIATPTGESRWINRPAAHDHVQSLRAAVDAVLVGVGTVVADDPLLNVRRVSGRNPARVVLDPRGRTPPGARCLDATVDGRRFLVVGRSAVTPAMPQGVEIVELSLRPDGRIDPPAVIAALFSRGLRSVLIEGGATTVSAFMEAGAVDRLHVLVAPVILGSGKSGLSLPPIDKMSEALRPETEVFPLAGGDVLFDCRLRTAAT